MISKEIAKFYEDKVFQYGLTYSGHSLACAAGVACVNYYKKAGLLENTQKVGKVRAVRRNQTKTQMCRRCPLYWLICSRRIC